MIIVGNIKRNRSILQFTYLHFITIDRYLQGLMLPFKSCCLLCFEQHVETDMQYIRHVGYFRILRF